MLKGRLFQKLKRIGPESRGLVPVVVQDRRSGAVLTVAYMDEPALEATVRTRKSHFYSRSRKRLWRKGESSGHTQQVREILRDCDADALLLLVDPKGAACHTGESSCFYERLTNGGFRRIRRTDQGKNGASILDQLREVIEDRRRHPSGASYVSQLLGGGKDRALKKVAEEAGEFLLAAKGGRRKDVVHEAADLLFHLWVALAQQRIPVDELYAELRRRTGCSGLEEKKRRGKR